jgi:hypothetical protein
MWFGGIVPIVWNRNKPLIWLALVAAAGYGAYMLARYMKVEADLNRRSAIVVQPKLDGDEVAEIGYIASMRDELFLRKENEINLVWFVKIPATGKVYSCSYEHGFSQFKTGDDVRLLHARDSSDADYGYVSGLHWETSGKTAEVWVVDEDELEILAEPDN